MRMSILLLLILSLSIIGNSSCRAASQLEAECTLPALGTTKMDEGQQNLIACLVDSTSSTGYRWKGMTTSRLECTQAVLRKVGGIPNVQISGNPAAIQQIGAVPRPGLACTSGWYRTGCFVMLPGEDNDIGPYPNGCIVDNDEWGEMNSEALGGLTISCCK